MLPVAARLKAEAVSALTKAICASSVSAGLSSNARSVCLFGYCASSWSVSRIEISPTSRRNEPVKLPAVAGGPDVLVRTDHHHRNGDPLQQLRQLPADPGGIEQNAAQRGGAFPQSGGDGGRAE